MSSSPSQNGSEAEAPQESSGQAQTAVTETIECPNCGRTFVGDYCPDCGQEADASLSPFDVASGFFRELMDLERGFWPTCKGLFTRPRTLLKEYLSGARREMAHPGRYLMTAIVLVYLVERLLVWSGVRGLYSFPKTDTELGRTPTLENLLTNWESIWLVRREAFYSSQEFQIFAYLLLAMLVSLMLFQLLRKRAGWGEALALGGFISGQMILYVAALAWLCDIISLLQYLLFAHLLTPTYGLSMPEVALNNFPFLYYLSFAYFYVIILTFDRSEIRYLDRKWNPATYIFNEKLIYYIFEDEPRYFFDNYMAVGLITALFQYAGLIGPVRVAFNNRILSAGILGFAGMILLPNLAIDIYQRVR